MGREGVNIGYKLLKHRGGVLNSYPGSLETPSVLNCTKQSGLWSAVVREGEEVGAFPQWPGLKSALRTVGEGVLGTDAGLMSPLLLLTSSLGRISGLVSRVHH